MPYEQDYNSIIDELRAIRSEDVKRPHHGIAAVCQRGMDLYEIARRDREELEAVGMPWHIAEDVRCRAGALRFADARLQALRSKHSDAQRQWRELEPVAREVLNHLIDILRCHLHNQPRILKRISGFQRFQRQAELPYALRLAVELVTTVKSQLQGVVVVDELVEKANALAPRLNAVLAEASMYGNPSGARDIRNRAYAHLRAASADLRRFARLAFRDNDRKLHQYASIRHRARGRDTNHETVEKVSEQAFSA